MKKFLSGSEEETMRVSSEICSSLKNIKCVAFTGGMGMGKTAFVRGALRAFGNSSFVCSPTYALVHDYGGEPHIYHFDMYRVTDEDDLYSTGFFDYLAEENSLLFIEWSENVTSSLPEETLFVDIAQGENENDRIITVEGGGF